MSQGFYKDYNLLYYNDKIYRNDNSNITNYIFRY